MAGLLPGTCGDLNFVECDSRHVLVPAARTMRDCRRDCRCPALAERLLESTIVLLEDLEDRLAGTASCDDYDWECEHKEAGMIGPPAFERYC